MPAKTATSASRPPFGLPELTVAVRTSLLSCRKAGKTRVFTPVREPSEESRVKLSDVLDSAKLSRFQYGVFALCALAVFVEGFDTQVIGYVAPALGKAWALRPGALGPVFVGGLFGLLGGSLLIAPLADRFGRRTIILWSTPPFLSGS
jgi:AAHS family 4-hydroxybenzoate transporter-like MFS transporter